MVVALIYRLLDTNHQRIYLAVNNCSLLSNYYRMARRKFSKLGIWMTVRKTRDFPITVNPRNLFHWTSLQVFFTLLFNLFRLIFSWWDLSTYELAPSFFHLQNWELSAGAWILMTMRMMRIWKRSVKPGDILTRFVMSSFFFLFFD